MKYRNVIAFLLGLSLAFGTLAQTQDYYRDRFIAAARRDPGGLYDLLKSILTPVQKQAIKTWLEPDDDEELQLLQRQRIEAESLPGAFGQALRDALDTRIQTLDAIVNPPEEAQPAPEEAPAAMIEIEGSIPLDGASLASNTLEVRSHDRQEWVLLRRTGLTLTVYPPLTQYIQYKPETQGMIPPTIHDLALRYPDGSIRTLDGDVIDDASLSGWQHSE